MSTAENVPRNVCEPQRQKLRVCVNARIWWALCWGQWKSRRLPGDGDSIGVCMDIRVFLFVPKRHERLRAYESYVVRDCAIMSQLVEPLPSEWRDPPGNCGNHQCGKTRADVITHGQQYVRPNIIIHTVCCTIYICNVCCAYLNVSAYSCYYICSYCWNRNRKKSSSRSWSSLTKMTR